MSGKKAAKRLTAPQARARLARLEGWAIVGGRLVKQFAFRDYHGTMAFVNALAWISHREDHHPDLRVGYDRCTVEYATHSAGGLTEKDFGCAAMADALLRS
jgi:4a-hydroxytetrahydrobiopterin dehydratase